MNLHFNRESEREGKREVSILYTRINCTERNTGNWPNKTQTRETSPLFLSFFFSGNSILSHLTKQKN